MADKKTKKKENKPKEEPANTEKIPKKKVVYAEIDDEVTTLFDKIKPLSARHIYIVAPNRAMIFQSIINLKILKRKADDSGKRIYFITNDTNGIYLAQQLGITVYDEVNSEGKPSLFSSESEDDHVRITPLKASVNSIEEDAPTRLKEKKISISEILKKTKKTPAVQTIKSPAKAKLKTPLPKFVLVTPNRHALIGLISVSLVILLVIIYIALPGVTIIITPKASPLEKSVNITLADYNKNSAELEMHPAHMIASHPISTTVTTSITHFTTGKKFSENSHNASGKLTIINTSSNEWPLIPRTRFQTDEGVVFRISDYATVPPKDSNGPGKIEVTVTADPLDAYSAVVGERGNIEATRFFLPGLTESSQKSVYAESYEPMAGGVSDYITYVSDEDMIAAEVRLKEALKKQAVIDLKAQVDIKTGESNGARTYILLDGEGAVILGEPEVTLPSGIIESEISEFEISGSIEVSGIYYDREAMLEILKNELLMKKSPQKELLRINENSTTYRIFEWDNVAGKIKLTANIKGIEQYEIDPDTENGQRLLTKIKEHIVGADIANAKQYIQNLPEINKVEIDSWPAWAPTIPNLPENIDFEIREAILVN